MYQLLFKVFLVRLEPELAHKLGTIFIGLLFSLGLIKPIAADKKTVMGLEFGGPLGMAAGFDKDGKHIRELHALGFSHVEVGTVTALAQPGNPKPRMFRLFKDKALINRMGFNNQGSAALAKRLTKLRETHQLLPIIGVNIGKSRLVELDKAIDDYSSSARSLANVADYFAVNVSSPNTPGLRSLQQVEVLGPILRAVKREVAGKPVLVKIAPDLSDADVIAIAELVNSENLAGVIAANTSTERFGISERSKVVAEPGGLSGPMLAPRARGLISLLREHLDSQRVVISVGGIMDAKEAQIRIETGADLVQSYTGFVYGGPSWARRIQRKLLASDN